MHTLSFRNWHHYGYSTTGIAVPVTLRVGEEAVRLEAKLDSGAEFCIFRREYADMLGLRIETGEPLNIGTAMGSFLTYGHLVSLSALGITLEVTVYFAAEKEIKRNVLGRHGWLEQTRVGLIDYDSNLFVSRYDDDAASPPQSE